MSEYEDPKSHKPKSVTVAQAPKQPKPKTPSSPDAATKDPAAETFDAVGASVTLTARRLVDAGLEIDKILKKNAKKTGISTSVYENDINGQITFALNELAALDWIANSRVRPVPGLTKENLMELNAAVSDLRAAVFRARDAFPGLNTQRTDKLLAGRDHLQSAAPDSAKTNATKPVTGDEPALAEKAIKETLEAATAIAEFLKGRVQGSHKEGLEKLGALVGEAARLLHQKQYDKLATVGKFLDTFEELMAKAKQDGPALYQELIPIENQARRLKASRP